MVQHNIRLGGNKEKRNAPDEGGDGAVVVPEGDAEEAEHAAGDHDGELRVEEEARDEGVEDGLHGGQQEGLWFQRGGGAAAEALREGEGGGDEEDEARGEGGAHLGEQPEEVLQQPVPQRLHVLKQ